MREADSAPPAPDRGEDREDAEEEPEPERELVSGSKIPQTLSRFPAPLLPEHQGHPAPGTGRS